MSFQGKKKGRFFPKRPGRNGPLISAGFRFRKRLFKQLESSLLLRSRLKRLDSPCEGTDHLGKFHALPPFLAFSKAASRIAIKRADFS
jgi:hypothetical protein